MDESSGSSAWASRWCRSGGSGRLPGVQLNLTDDQESFRSTTRRSIEAETPISEVRRLRGSEHGFDRDWWTRAAYLGWTAMLVSEAAGGGSISARPLADTAIVADEMGRMVTPGPFVPVNVVAAALNAGGPTAHADTLAALVSGTAVAAWALGEPGNRWDKTDLATTAVIDGTEVVVTGHKSYVEAADSADYVLVAARSGTNWTQVLVPVGTPGVTVIPARSVDFVRRYGDVRLDAVRLPLTAVVGSFGAAGEDIERQICVALILQCAEKVGGLDRVFEFTLGYMNDRYAFGRPISSYQALKHRAADLLLLLETAKGRLDAAIAAFDDHDPAAAVEASVAKAYIGAHALHIIQECTQFHGGIGVTWEHDLHLYLRRATLSRAVYGSPEQHRERICTLIGL
jgi:alkylation response protein AidB-like acyl-CoA dehydrogenase